MARLLLWFSACFWLLACEAPQIAPEPVRLGRLPAPAMTRPVADEQPPPAIADATIDEVLAVQRALAPHDATLGDPPDLYGIPPEARPLFARLERAWLGYLLARLPRLLPKNLDDRTLSRELFEPLKRGGVAQGFEAQSFGSLAAVVARTHPGSLLGVVVTTTHSCGSDGSLFLFDTSAPGPRPVLTAAAQRRESIADGQLGLDYALIPSAAGGDPEVVVASTTPWCSSAWRTLRYDVLAPAADPARPKRVLSREDSVWIGNRVAELDAGPGWFQIRYDSWDTLGGNVVAAKHARFSHTASSWSTSAPQVAQAPDLVHAWASLPPARASALVRPEARASAAVVHALLSVRRDDERGYLAIEEESRNRARAVFECADCQSLPSSIRFELVMTGGAWQIAAVSVQNS